MWLATWAEPLPPGIGLRTISWRRCFSSRAFASGTNCVVNALPPITILVMLAEALAACVLRLRHV